MVSRVHRLVVLFCGLTAFLGLSLIAPLATSLADEKGCPPHCTDPKDPKPTPKPEPK